MENQGTPGISGSRVQGGLDLPVAEDRSVKEIVDWDETFKDMDLEEAVGTALGAASACWDHLEGAGVFESDRCSLIRGALLDRIAREQGVQPKGAHEEPTTPGFYKYSGGAQTMLFMLAQEDDGPQWYVWSSNSDGQHGVLPCQWGYIEQALGVWGLVRI